MRKMIAVFKREYLSSVRKKMFIFMTLFFPVLMAAIFFIPMMVVARTLGGKAVAVVDGTGQLRDAFAKNNKARGRALPSTLNIDYVDARGKDLTAVTKPYLSRLSAGGEADRPLDALLIVPVSVIRAEKSKMTFYSRSSTDVITQQL